MTGVSTNTGLPTASGFTFSPASASEQWGSRSPARPHKEAATKIAGAHNAAVREAKQREAAVLCAAIEPPSQQTDREFSTETEKLKPNTAVAVAFLDALDPLGRQDLVAIDPDLPKGHPGNLEAATFRADERDKMRAWIDARQGKKNLYTSVNRARDDAPRDWRLKKENIGFVRAIVADIDASKIRGGDPSGANFRKELERLQEVADALTKEACPPNLLVNSGGGLQAWWQLKPAVEATAQNIELVEGIGRTIRQRYGGDSVFDVARIMRLPGTVNMLSPEKRQQGRSPVVATVLMEKSKGGFYELETLKAWAPPTPDNKPAGSSNKPLPDIDMDRVREATTYEELPGELRTKFERYCQERPVVAHLWKGEPAPGQNDTSASGYEFALCGYLKPSGLFDPTEFAQLVAVWPRRSVQHADDFERQVKNCWAHRLAPYGGEGFDAVEIEPRESAGAATAAAWESEPDDLWRDKAPPADLPTGVVPEIIERYARDHARDLGVEAGAVAAGLITTLGAAIPAGNTLQMRQKSDRWPVRPITWTAIIARSGENKSATVACAVAPLKAIDAKLQRDYVAAKRLYDAKHPRSSRKKAARTPPPSADVVVWPEFESPPLGRQKIIHNATRIP